MPLSLVNWNVQWAMPRAHRRHEILRRIDEHTPEIVCLTETHNELLAQDGHTICAHPDYGYPIKHGRRKVILWSSNPWEQINDLGHVSLPPGRFISGSTQTTLGQVTVVGVCIPWFGSRTESRRGQESRERWEDHEHYIAGLADLLKRKASKRIILMGDFNQRIGEGSRAPDKLQQALQDALPTNMSIATSELSFQGRKTIDHIALSDDLAAESLDVISNITGNGKLSDHFGVTAEVVGQ